MTRSASSPITARTQVVGLIGWPVGHSVSPAMHNAAFDALGLDWRYIPLPVSPDPVERIGEAVRGLRALGMRGANVTVPYKQSVIPFVDALTPAAQAIGAVNTIVKQPDGLLLGDNTDARGLVADLRDNGIDPAGSDVLLLGAGGSARAAAFGLAESGAPSVTILNRTLQRAEALAEAMCARFPNCTWQSGSIADLLHHADARLILNCTTLGMEPDLATMPWDPAVQLRRDQTIYDLVYNPTPTRLTQFATQCGARAVNGKGMLVWQGAIAFELWTGFFPPVEVMQRAIGIR